MRILLYYILFFFCTNFSFASVWDIFLQELQKNRDTDQDQISDYNEIHIYNTNPNKKDTDGDGIDDNIEISLGEINLNLNPTVHSESIKQVALDAIKLEPSFLENDAYVSSSVAHNTADISVKIREKEALDHNWSETNVVSFPMNIEDSTIEFIRLKR